MNAQAINKKNLLPKHVAIIMDGNGRWATQRGMKRALGHQEGSLVAENIVRYAQELGIKYITLYAFSSENWRRDKDEVNAVMDILESYLKKDIGELIKNKIRIKAIGDLDRLPKSLQSTLKEISERTKKCSGLTITLALSYGSWGEVVLACKKIATKVKNKDIKIEEINEETLRQNLYTHDLPDPDLLIRTSGEIRTSNFLLMQLSYSELYFTDKLWPDFQRCDFDDAISSFMRRKRKFGA